MSEPINETCNHSFVTPDGGSWKAVALGECPWCEIERLQRRVAELKRALRSCLSVFADPRFTDRHGHEAMIRNALTKGESQ